MKNVLLVIPPDYDHHFPPLGTPALAAYLKSSGVRVSQTDLNLSYRDFLCDHIEAPLLTLPERRGMTKTLLSVYFSRALRDRYYSDLLARKNENGLPSLPYGNNSNSSFFFTERLLSSPHLKRYLEDEEENTYLQFYERIRVADRLRKDEVDLLGISIISPSQAIPALTLGYLVKRRLPSVRVLIGGPWVTLYRDRLTERRDLLLFFDGLIAGEGETALASRGAAVSRDEEMDTLPCPDFDGLPLEDYNGFEEGRPALTYEMSRGCYWSKCAYCVDLPLPKPSYRAKNASRVARDIRELKERYNTRHLMLGDPGMSPRLLNEVSRAILGSGPTDVTWWCMARLDPGFTRETFERAFRAGLRQINFGFESASDAVCDRLDKGNRRERSARVIRDCAAAGIRVDLQTMLGLPGETFDEGLQTVDFLVSHRAAIANVTFNIYYLTPANHVYNDPERYGIVYDRDDALPFRFFIPFKNTKGMSAHEASQLQRICEGLWHKNKGAATASAAAHADGPSRRVVFSLLGESVVAEV